MIDPLSTSRQHAPVNDSLDDKEGFKPTELDLNRLLTMPVDGRVESENKKWIAFRYPPKARAGWREFTLLFDGGFTLYECSCLEEVRALLNAREEERLGRQKNRKKKD